MGLLSFFGRNGYLPHGYCFTWSPGLLWSMVAADALIAAAYFSIPLGIAVFFRQRPNARGRGVGALFGAFIFACGVTHLMDIWTIWRPDYGPQALAKGLTAAISIATAIAVWRLMPRSLRIASAEQLQAAIDSLEIESVKRRGAESQAAQVEENLALTLASIDAGLITTDLAGNVARMNAVAERITGWSEAEAIGHSYWDVFSRENRPAEFLCKNAVETVGDQAYRVETAHRVVALSRQGARTTVEVNTALTRSGNGAVRGILTLLGSVAIS